VKQIETHYYNEMSTRINQVALAHQIEGSNGSLGSLVNLGLLFLAFLLFSYFLKSFLKEFIIKKVNL